MEGPAGTGKSRALLEKVNACAIRHPGMRALLVRRTRQSMTESVLVTFESKVLPPGCPVAEGPRRQNRHSYVYPAGSEIVVGGMDRAGKIMSTEYDMVLAFEACELREADWEAALSRLRNGRMPYQQAIADTNPDAPTHWLNRRAEQGRMLRLRSRHEDNPSVTDDYLDRLSRLTGARHDRLCKGIWSGAEGLVYDDWDPGVHVVDRFNPPAHWRRIRAIDFGYNHPFVCQWWAIDHDGRMFLYRELYQTRRLVEDHARRIVELSRGERIEATVADHDAEDRATLERHGIVSVPAFKAIRAGIQAVSSRLRTDDTCKPRLCVMRDCLLERDSRLEAAGAPCCTEQEFAAYVWLDGSKGRDAGEMPRDEHNHGLDALRYAVAYVDQPANRALELRVIG